MDLIRLAFDSLGNNTLSMIGSVLVIAFSVGFIAFCFHHLFSS